jgi:hypothetical protein
MPFCVYYTLFLAFLQGAQPKNFCTTDQRQKNPMWRPTTQAATLVAENKKEVAITSPKDVDELLHFRLGG